MRRLEFTDSDRQALADLFTDLRLRLAERETGKLRAGDLPALFESGRTKSWQITKDPTFPRPIVLGPRLKLWDRDEVLAWMESQKAESPGPRRPGAASLGASIRTVASGAPTDGRTSDEYRKTRRRASRAR